MALGVWRLARCSNCISPCTLPFAPSVIFRPSPMTSTKLAGSDNVKAALTSRGVLFTAITYRVLPSRFARTRIAPLFTLPSGPDWTAASLRRRLCEHGHSIDAKTLGNCLNYLVKSGRLIRISRGQYAVAGFGVITSDELFPSHDMPKGGENED